MSFTDTTYMLQILMYRFGKSVFIFLLLCNNFTVYSIFESRKEYTYSYNALSSSGVLLPSGASSSWGFHGKLVIQAEQNAVVMQVLFTTILKKYYNIKNKIVVTSFFYLIANTISNNLFIIDCYFHYINILQYINLFI